MNFTSKHTKLGLALGAALGTAFAVAGGHSGALIAVGIGIGIALGIFYWRKELPSLAARRQVSKTKANS